MQSKKLKDPIMVIYTGYMYKQYGLWWGGGHGPFSPWLWHCIVVAILQLTVYNIIMITKKNILNILFISHLLN
jgi:hypothetical protein